MKKEDMTTAGLLAEAVGIVAGLVYIGMQIYYGISYGVAAKNIILNVVMLLLVYAGLTLLARYPEKVNSLPKEKCSGMVRRDTLRMLAGVKLIFVLSLLGTSICDVMGIEISSWYSVVVVLLIVGTVFYQEGKIIHTIRRKK